MAGAQIDLTFCNIFFGYNIKNGFLVLSEHQDEPWMAILQSSVPVGSQMPVELRLALNLNNTTPTHPPGKVEIQLEIDYIWSVDRWGMVWPTFIRDWVKQLVHYLSTSHNKLQLAIASYG